jgi:hypothetical protein
MLLRVVLIVIAIVILAWLAGGLLRFRGPRRGR